jgi:hypothetical protein
MIMDVRERVLSQEIPCGNTIAVAGDRLQIVQKLNQGGTLSVVLAKSPPDGSQNTAFEVEGMINAPQGIFLSLQLPFTVTSEDARVDVWIVKITGGDILMVPTQEEFEAVSKLSRPKPIQPLLESLIGFFS